MFEGVKRFFRDPWGTTKEFIDESLPKIDKAIDNMADTMKEANHAVAENTGEKIDSAAETIAQAGHFVGDAVGSPGAADDFAQEVYEQRDALKQKVAEGSAAVDEKIDGAAEAAKETATETAEGMEEAPQMIAETIPAVQAYGETAVKQLVLGNFTEESNLLGTGLQIGTGVLGVDLPGDIRDITYDLTHWRWSWAHAGQTGLDVVGVVPVVGAIKYVKKLRKYADAVDLVEDAVKLEKKTEHATDVGRNLDHAAETATDAAKQAEHGAAKAARRADLGEADAAKHMDDRPRSGNVDTALTEEVGKITKDWYVGKSGEEIAGMYENKVAGRHKVSAIYAEDKTASEILREELHAAGIASPPYNNQTHHIIPEGIDLEEAKTARNILKKCGVELNSAANGVFLPAEKGLEHAGGAAVHNGGHSKEYVKYVAEKLKDANPQNADDAIVVLNEIRQELLEGKLNIHKVHEKDLPLEVGGKTPAGMRAPPEDADRALLPQDSVVRNPQSQTENGITGGDAVKGGLALGTISGSYQFSDSQPGGSYSGTEENRRHGIQPVSSRELLQTIITNVGENNAEQRRLAAERSGLQGPPLTWEQAFQRAASEHCGGRDLLLAKEAGVLRQERADLARTERQLSAYGRASGLDTTLWRHAPNWLKSDELKCYEAEQAQLENRYAALDRRETEHAGRTQELQKWLEQPAVQAQIREKAPACLEQDRARLDRLQTVETRLVAAEEQGRELSRLFNTASLTTWQRGHALYIRGDVQDMRNILDQSGEIAQQMAGIQQMQVLHQGPGLSLGR